MEPWPPIASSGTLFLEEIVPIGSIWGRVRLCYCSAIDQWGVDDSEEQSQPLEQTFQLQFHDDTNKP